MGLISAAALPQQPACAQSAGATLRPPPAPRVRRGAAGMVDRGLLRVNCVIISKACFGWSMGTARVCHGGRSAHQQLLHYADNELPAAEQQEQQHVFAPMCPAAATLRKVSGPVLLTSPASAPSTSQTSSCAAAQAAAPCHCMASTQRLLPNQLQMKSCG